MKRLFLLSLALLLLSPLAFSQKKGEEDKDEDKDTPPWSSSTFSGLKFRSIGPAFYTGRIADIAIHPEDENVVQPDVQNIYRQEHNQGDFSFPHSQQDARHAEVEHGESAACKENFQI